MFKKAATLKAKEAYETKERLEHEAREKEEHGVAEWCEAEKKKRACECHNKASCQLLF